MTSSRLAARPPPPARMPFLTSCCCGFSVRTGTKAIAVLSLVYSVLGLLMVGTFKVERDRLLGHNKRRHWDTSSYTDYNSLHNIHRELEGREWVPTLAPTTVIFATARPEGDTGQRTEATDEAEKERKAARLELIMTVYAVSVSVNFLVSLSLLAGVRLGQRWLLVPWIGWNVLSLLVSQMAVFYTPSPNKAMTTIPDLFSTVISVYCIMCVVSYFQELTLRPPISATSRPSWPGLAPECGPPWGAPAGEPQSSLGPDYMDPATHLSPRRPHLVVSLPHTPDMGPPPAYPAVDPPPCYDPPPPYPGTPDSLEAPHLKQGEAGLDPGEGKQ